MWAEAAKWLNKFDEAVLTGVDAEGYPVSIRVNPRDYDATTGTLTASFPAALPVAEGPANVLAHTHDEKMWHLNMIQIKGRLESRDGGWVFQSTNFNAPSKLAFVEFLRGISAAANKYLDKRGLKRPPVNWSAVKEIQRRAKAR
jgi:hypothetical protein